jgi:hypothetical protein
MRRRSGRLAALLLCGLFVFICSWPVPAMGQTCGQPYPNATCNLTTYTLPTTPNMGNTVGAGTQITDPNLGSKVIRITDVNANRPTLPNAALLVNSSGSGEENLISCGPDATRLAMIADTGGAQFPITFNPLAAIANPRLYTTTLASTNGFAFPAGTVPIGWSRVCPTHAQLAYVLGDSDDATIETYNFAGNCASCTPPTPTTIYSFETSSNGLGPNFAVTYNLATGGTTQNDSDIVAGFGGGIEWTNSFSYTTGYYNGVISGNIVYPTTGNLGEYLYEATNAPCTGQASGTPVWNQTVSGTNSDGGCTMMNIGKGFQGDQGTQYIGVYRPGSGVRMLNTATGGVSGDWGPTGQIPSDPCLQYVHEVKVGKIGGAQGWIRVGLATPCTTATQYTWNYGASSLTGSFYSLCETAYCGGHTSAGMLGFTNNSGDDPPNFMAVCFVYGSSSLCPMSVTDGIIPALPAGGIQAGLDNHVGWNSLNDSLPFCGTTALNGVPTKAWTNEVMCWLASYLAGRNPFRFAQTENTGASSIFQCQIAVSSVSADGEWIMITSDWQNTLGSGRCDVFAVQLSAIPVNFMIPWTRNGVMLF